ncbi:MAG: TatD family hydrolase [Deltaproteobacteria bacterium]|nr:TatD family hydrolase [Deltaproteobacteria bacterium]MBW2297713.1 TatD family hydrolase [Deltaproteobacteria bacterium]MBW2612092.1 TatD family hydrolase [Deltaproteobacteria bacterium]MBW2633830.1 TatD family hydrolase [Deltaproteobacteria bacterium]MBW2676588.1 TatD family hydrolase [Deltaproteobacteria bacterium]
MKLFDSHCHLDDRTFAQDLENTIQSARDVGVFEMMTVGVGLKSSLRTLDLAESHDGLYASVGVHPHDAQSCNDTVMNELSRLAEHDKVRAWGETGLDFNRMYSPRKDQELWFIRQVLEADNLGLPLIFHERDSQGRFLEILQAHPNAQRNGVVHCFSGNEADLSAYLDLGFYIGITGILTIKTRGAGLRGLVPKIPMDRLLIETDAPYLTPAPQKNKTRRNEPAFVKSVLLKLAEVRQEGPETLAAATTANARRLFNINT